MANAFLAAFHIVFAIVCVYTYFYMYYGKQNLLLLLLERPVSTQNF